VAEKTKAKGAYLAGGEVIALKAIKTLNHQLEFLRLIPALFALFKGSWA
jgi:hypothetical protein